MVEKIILFLSKIIIVLGVCLTTPLFSMDENTSTLKFFFDSSYAPMVGLSCSSELDCKNKCSNTEECQKKIPTCLNCIGARSPYLSDFFNNIGELTTACFEQGFLNTKAESLFRSVDMVPIFPISPYNPLGLKDPALMLKFISLCPLGTAEPVAIAFTDSISHAVKEISLIQCGESLFPLVRLGEDCAEKADLIIQYINSRKEKEEASKISYQNSVLESEYLSLKYDILQFSDYVEGQYIGCTDSSEKFCQNLCHSSLSCVVPTDNQMTSNGISTFNNSEFKSCGLERFSADVFMSYLKSTNSFVFNSSSLYQTYDLPESVGDFKDFTVINSILKNFPGIFQAIDKTEDSSFFISDAYQKRIEAKINSFCDSSSSAFIFGHKDQVERVFCRSGKNGYFKILANSNESCADKAAKLFSVNPGVSNEKL